MIKNLLVAHGYSACYWVCVGCIRTQGPCCVCWWASPKTGWSHCCIVAPPQLGPLTWCRKSQPLTSEWWKKVFAAKHRARSWVGSYCLNPRLSKEVGWKFLYGLELVSWSVELMTFLGWSMMLCYLRNVWWSDQLQLVWGLHKVTFCPDLKFSYPDHSRTTLAIEVLIRESVEVCD